MDFKTAVITVIVGVLGTMLVGSILNFPDMGAILAIAFVGGRIIWMMNN